MRTLMRKGLTCSVLQLPRTSYEPYSIRLSSPDEYTIHTLGLSKKKRVRLLCGGSLHSISLLLHVSMLLTMMVLGVYATMKFSLYMLILTIS